MVQLVKGERKRERRNIFDTALERIEECRQPSTNEETRGGDADADAAMTIHLLIWTRNSILGIKRARAVEIPHTSPRQ